MPYLLQEQRGKTAQTLIPSQDMMFHYPYLQHSPLRLTWQLQEVLRQKTPGKAVTQMDANCNDPNPPGMVQYSQAVCLMDWLDQVGIIQATIWHQQFDASSLH